MMQIKIIEPIKKVLKTDDNECHNVCAYCRVSTDEFDQRNSLASQKQFFEQYFSKHNNWTNVGIFADEGISGTSLEKRDEFNRMISLAKRKNIDIILTKEVSRFSRNVQDLMNVVESLRKKEVYVWFLSDDINTESIDYRERLVESATSAEKESLRTSRRVRWGQQQQMQRGIVFGRREMFGYNIKRNKLGEQEFEIISEEAEIINKIFQWFANGDGTHVIAQRLETQGYKTKRYKNGWSNTVILRILRNEKYVGDLAQGKTYTPDPLTHKKKYNRGESYKFFIENHHPESAIIPRALWEKVQAQLAEKESSEEIKNKFSNRYWTSGKIYCGCCGCRYVSYTKKLKDSTYKAWICFENHRHGQKKKVANELGEAHKVGCDNKRVNDKVLKIAIKDIVSHIILPHKENFSEELLGAIGDANTSTDFSKQIKVLENKINSLKKDLDLLTEKLIKDVISDEIYISFKKNKETQIFEIQSRIHQLNADSTEAQKYALKSKYDQINKMISLSDNDLNEDLFARITKKIIIHPQNVLEIHLSFILHPIYLRYKTYGKGADYDAIFDVLSQEEIEEIQKYT